MVKTLIVGLRNRGAAWARAVNAHPGFVIAGIADVDAGVLESRGAELGIAAEARHAGIGEALATGRYEAAIVVVPNHLHYPVAKTVIEAGVPCLLEKPFTEEIPHAEELVALAASRHVPLVIGQNYRYKPQFRIAAERLASGTLGRLGAIHAVFHRSRPPRHEHERPMRFPLLYLQGIHHLDWILSVLPAPITELHVEHRLPPWSPWSSPSICVLSARCADGVLVSYDASYECHGEQTPYNGLWRLECEGGDLVMDAEQRLWRTDASGRTLLHEPQDSDMVASDGGLLDALAAMMGGGPEAPTSGRNNLATLRLLFDVIGSGAAW